MCFCIGGLCVRQTYTGYKNSGIAWWTMLSSFTCHSVILNPKKKAWCAFGECKVGMFCSSFLKHPLQEKTTM
ncbi:MAG TPA: hypothetical protein DCE42_30225 [Myxococcales bacterium]|nr:hypothetical protein [Deltaproteobacteria bacterium]MBU53687.1 hypothetical protein [Deltaproteobacteria bacterium]HAA59070.1 hypothetical protein [Myxococcales bacterium]